jgi:predicted ATP-binding protein involved in virulence
MSDRPILTSVEVEGLFGFLDYRIDFDNQSNLSLIYGENGSGKTTVLRLIYAALSPNSSEGLRSFIHTVAFRSLKIATSIGASVEITRKEAVAGSYEMSASTMDGRSECFFKDHRESPGLDEVQDRLKQFDFDIHFLSDNRLLMSTADFFNQASESRNVRVGRRETDERPTLVRTARGEGDRTWLNVEMTVKQVEYWFRQQVFQQGTRGQRSVNHIYLEVTKTLVSAWRNSADPTQQEYEALLSEFDRMKEKSIPVFQLQTIAPISFDEFKSFLVNAPEDRRPDLVRILRPFIEATSAQLEALSPIATVMTLLMQELNSFLKRKQAHFDVFAGMEVNSASGKIPLSSLSSGEKQLLLLLCSAFLSRQSRCVFLIDEPELSLNVYWQRTLPRTLQRIVAGVPTQYVLATHSLEILTEFREHISNLEAKNVAP